MRIASIVRGMVWLMALSAVLLGVSATSASAAASAASPGTGWVRLAHLSPNTPAVDVYLYSFGHSSAWLVLHHVGYGAVSPYESLASGDYTVAMRAAGAAATSKPVLSTSLVVVSGHAYTPAGAGAWSRPPPPALGGRRATPPAGAGGRAGRA